MPNTKDLRIRRTHQRINTHFKELVETIGYDQISVVLLMNKSKTSRTTFYSHYSGLQDLYTYHVEQLVSHFIFLLDETLFLSQKGDLTVGFKKTLIDQMSVGLTKVKEDSLFVTRMMEAGNNKLFAETIISVLSQGYSDEVDSIVAHKDQLRLPISLVLNFSVHIIVSTIYWWLTDPNDLEPRIVAETLLELIIHLPFEIENNPA